MPLALLGLKLTAARLRRIAVFFCLLLLLCAGAGLFGAHVLYSDQVVDLISVAVVDHDDTMETRMFYGFLTDMAEDADILTFHRVGEAEGLEMLERGEVIAVFSIPEGFAQSVMVGRNDPFTIILDGDSFLKTTMITLQADAYLDMLRTGQVGVFSALDIADAVGGQEAYDAMFYTANLRFLSAMLNREGLQAVEYLSATGSTGAVAYYAVAAYVFICFLGAVLFLDLYRGITARPVLCRLRAAGFGSLRCTAELFAAAALPFLLVAALCAGGMGIYGLAGGAQVATPLALLPALLLTALCAGGFCVGVALLLRSELAGNLLVTGLSVFGLFLSGGVLPVAYLSAPLQAVSRLIPNYWLARLFTGALDGAADRAALGVSLAFVAGLFGLCWLGVSRRGRAGETP